jgi:hypothetical protein
MITLGPAQYRWRANGRDGLADPDGPPAESTLTAGKETVFDLPAASLSVIRGTLGATAPITR